jgi:sodium pump decarboxylase gamma subunit
MLDLVTLTVEDLGTAGNLKEYAGNVTLSGLVIVFGMLVLLVLIIAIFGFVMGGTRKKAAKSEATKSKTKAPTQNSVAAAPVSKPEAKNDGSVVAAISAAVAMMYEGTDKTPVIRSIKPASTGVRSIWKQAGILNNTRSF